jgi:hypothetical protein
MLGFFLMSKKRTHALMAATNHAGIKIPKLKSESVPHAVPADNCKRVIDFDEADEKIKPVKTIRRHPKDRLTSSSKLALETRPNSILNKVGVVSGRHGQENAPPILQGNSENNQGKFQQSNPEPVCTKKCPVAKFSTKAKPFSHATSTKVLDEMMTALPKSTSLSRKPPTPSSSPPL